MGLTKELMKGFSFFPRILRDKERKPVFRILWEVASLTFRHKSFPAHYVSRHLYKKEIRNINDYIPNNTLRSLDNKINDPGASHILSNKLFFYLYYGKFFRNLAKILMYNHRSAFILNSKWHQINSIQEFETVINDLVTVQSESKSIFIKKTYDSHGGANTYRIHAADLPLQKTFVEELFDEVTGSAYLFQETILQHPEMDRINPSCVNTLRMDTFIDKNGIVELIAPYLRMSTSNLHVDNTSSGGCCVGINLDTGRLKKYGYTSITKTGGKILTAHPVTNTEFLDFEIPFFDEAKQFALHVASLVPNLRLIGWDIAITKSGPLLIEGNLQYDITNHDLTYGGYKTNPVFKKVLEEFHIHA